MTTLAGSAERRRENCIPDAWITSSRAYPTAFRRY